MITLYTTHCPQCTVLSKKLDQAGVQYDTCEDIEVMQSKGFMSAPMLEVDGEVMNFKQAVDWIAAKEGN